MGAGKNQAERIKWGIWPFIHPSIWKCIKQQFIWILVSSVKLYSLSDRCSPSRSLSWFQPRFWLPLAPESELKRLPPTSLLQRGHNALILNHLSTHSLWKKWEHGNSLSSSLFAYFPKQMQQTCREFINN